MSVLFRDYDQAGLDAQYNNREHVPNHPKYYETWEPMCSEVLAQFDHHIDLKYGDSPREGIDLILPKGDGPHPVQLYIHGGYWMSRSKTDQTFLARPFVEAGAAFGLIEYDLIPDVRINDIVRQCRSAAAWVHANAAAYNLDPNRIYVSGHSAGGHLTVMLSLTDWPTFCGGPTDLMKGGCAISGIYDLTPIQLCYMQKTLGFSDEDLFQNSPIRMTAVPNTDLIIAVGGAETDEFRRQSQDFNDNWNAKGATCTFLEQPECNHFSILSNLANADSSMVEGMLRQMSVD